MQLLHINYKGKKPRAILLLLLQYGDNYIIGLDSSKISEADRVKIRVAKAVSVDWLKKNCPNSYRKAFRKLHKNKSKIVEIHEIR